MSSTSSTATLLRILLLGTLPMAAGCASAPPNRVRDSVASMKSLERTMTTLDERLGQALEALEQLTQRADADLRPEYDAYSKYLARVEATGKSMSSGAADMRAKARRYFEDWEKSLATVESPKLRQHGGARRDETRQEFDGASAEVDSLSRELDGVLARLKDVHTFLGHDLNMAAVQAIEDLIASAAKDGEGLRASIPKVLARLAEVRVRISAEAGGAPEA